MVMGKLESHMQKNKTKLLFVPYTKINSKLIKGLNIRPKTKKNYMEENIGTKLMDFDLRENFMNLIPKAREVKSKMNEWDYISLKTSAQQKKLPTKQKGNQLNGGRYLHIRALTSN